MKPKHLTEAAAPGGADMQLFIDNISILKVKFKRSRPDMQPGHLVLRCRAVGGRSWRCRCVSSGRC